MNEVWNGHGYFPPQSLAVYLLSSQQLSSCSQCRLLSFTWLPKRILKQTFLLPLTFRAIHETELQNNNKTKKKAEHNRQQRAKMHTTAPQPLSISAALNKTPYWHSGERDCVNNSASALRHGHVPWHTPPWAQRRRCRHTDGDTQSTKARTAAQIFPLRELARAARNGQKAAHESSEGPPLSWQQCPTACCRARQRKHLELLQSAFSVATHLPLR